jgi:upstream activation factor subunit UAF30
MSFDISSLEPQIRDILSAPGTDLSTISAKSVRRKLLEADPRLTADFLKEHKQKVDAVIGSVFEAVSAEAGGVEAPPEPKRKRTNGTVKVEEQVEEDGEEEDEAPTPPPKKSKKGVKKELSDAELARQLSDQINGRARRSGAANGSSTKKKRAHKSADFVDSDSDGDGVSSTKKKKRKSGGGGAKGGFAKEYSLRSVTFIISRKLSY